MSAHPACSTQAFSWASGTLIPASICHRSPKKAVTATLAWEDQRMRLAFWTVPKIYWLGDSFCSGPPVKEAAVNEPRTSLSLQPCLEQGAKAGPVLAAEALSGWVLSVSQLCNWLALDTHPIPSEPYEWSSICSGEGEGGCQLLGGSKLPP